MRATPSLNVPFGACLGIGLGISLGVTAAPARADVPLTQRTTWTGAIDFFATGASIAVDGDDADTTMVDTILHPATVDVLGADLPADANLVQAFVYWSGTVSNQECTGTTHDNTIDFTPPGASAAVAVTADVCHCSDAGVSAYDTQVCRADVTALIGDMTGSYTVDGFRASIQNRSTDNASFSLVLVYSQIDLPPRRIALYDGVQTMYTAAGSTSVTTAVTLDGLKVDNPPQGDLTWYALEGDKGGSGGEGVTLSGQPGGLSVALGDDVNPVTNPMNHTINTTSVVQTGTLGADIDRFAIDEALTWHDASLLMTFSAGTDKYWLAYTIVGVNVFEAVFGAASTKTWTLAVDADHNGVPTAGDTIRYTLHLENTGRASAAPVVDDVLAGADVAGWTLVSAGGGESASTADTLHVTLPVMAVGDSADIVYDVVIAAIDRADRATLENTATFDSTPEGDRGDLVAAPVVLRHDADEDGLFDDDDNCPQVPNPAQEDGDGDHLGDACDACPADAANDADGDHVCADGDNCPALANASQTDRDHDDLGDACDSCPDDVGNDADHDGACDNLDNCAGLANASQADADHDARGDACDPCISDATDDGDRDGHCENLDNCPGLANQDQADGDEDGVGDACDACPVDPANDADQDGLCAAADNCPHVANADQADQDHDGIGDPCDTCQDADGDGVCAGLDNCPLLANQDQADQDDDGAGDACDACPSEPGDTCGGDCPDDDHDGWCDSSDTCPGLTNEDQSDSDGDGLGNACDTCPNDRDNDQDHDGICADLDNCPVVANASQADTDHDGVGDACRPACADDDRDGVCDAVDNCPGVANTVQSDGDSDGIGDSCDHCPSDPENDRDGDGLCSLVDNCPLVPNPDQADADRNGRGDACEAAPDPIAEGGGCGGCAGGGAGDQAVGAALGLALLLRQRRQLRRA